MSIITGSDIEIEYDFTTGKVEKVKGDNPYKISKIDVEEYKKHYELKEMPENIDILTIGYWYGENKYQEPEHDYRKELLNL